MTRCPAEVPGRVFFALYLSMTSHCAFSYRGGIELLALFGLGGMFLLIHLLPIPQAQRTPIDLFLLIVGVYLMICFRVLFPRSHYAPRVI